MSPNEEDIRNRIVEYYRKEVAGELDTAELDEELSKALERQRKLSESPEAFRLRPDLDVELELLLEGLYDSSPEVGYFAGIESLLGLNQDSSRELTTTASVSLAASSYTWLDPEGENWATKNISHSNGRKPSKGLDTKPRRSVRQVLTYFANDPLFVGMALLLLLGAFFVWIHIPTVKQNNSVITENQHLESAFSRLGVQFVADDFLLEVAQSDLDDRDVRSRYIQRLVDLESALNELNEISEDYSSENASLKLAGSYLTEDFGKAIELAEQAIALETSEKIYARSLYPRRLELFANYQLANKHFERGDKFAERESLIRIIELDRSFEYGFGVAAAIVLLGTEHDVLARSTLEKAYLVGEFDSLNRTHWVWGDLYVLELSEGNTEMANVYLDRYKAAAEEFKAVKDSPAFTNAIALSLLTAGDLEGALAEYTIVKEKAGELLDANDESWESNWLRRVYVSASCSKATLSSVLNNDDRLAVSELRELATTVSNWGLDDRSPLLRAAVGNLGMAEIQLGRKENNDLLVAMGQTRALKILGNTKTIQVDGGPDFQLLGAANAVCIPTEPGILNRPPRG